MSSRSPHIRPAICVAVSMLLFSGLVYLVPWQSSSTIHTLMESVATCLAALVATLALAGHRNRDDNAFLWLGLGFLSAAVIDAFHTVATTEEVAASLKPSLTALSSWSWFASRAVLSVSLVMAVWAVIHPSPRRDVSLLRASLLVVLVTLACCVLLLVVPLPRMYWAESFVHRPYELLPALLFGLALIQYRRSDVARHDTNHPWWTWLLVVAVVCQFVVMTWSPSLVEGKFALAHMLKIVSYLLAAAGLVEYVSLAFTDVQRLDAQYRQSVNELERAHEGLEAFVRSASHDLKAPLRHIFGFCGFIRDDAGDRLTQSEMEDLDRVMKAANRMSELIDSLLGFAKVGATSLQYDTFDLGELVDMSIAQLPLDQQAHVELGEMSKVTGDRALLSIVLQNLIENGLKYVEDGPPRVIVQSTELESSTRISIIDNGIGVEGNQRTRVFEPGMRGVTESQFAGTGFGLATCARIVKAHGGEIWVESNPDQGSTFSFTIPRSNGLGASGLAISELAG